MQATSPAGARMTRSRPTGVTILAVLELLGGLAGLAGGAALLGLGGVMASGLALALGAVSMVVGIFNLLLFWGLWTLKPWALQLAMIFSLVGMVMGGVSVAMGNYGGIVSILFSLLILYYLTRPGVKAAFGMQ